MKNQDVTIEVLKFIHEKGKATRGEVEVWLNENGVDTKTQHVNHQMVNLFNNREGLEIVEHNKSDCKLNKYGLQTNAYFALLNYFNYEHAQKDSKSAEVHAERSINLAKKSLETATRSFWISISVMVVSIVFSVYSIFFHTPTVKIYEKEKAIESKQTFDNKPIIKPAPNMLE